MKVSPAGDKLTLEPSSITTGSVKNPNDGFRALIHDGDTVLKIGGEKHKPVPVPEGNWKLVSYTINLTEPAKPAEPSKKDGKKAAEEPSALRILAEGINAFISPVRIGGPPTPLRSRLSMVSAQATSDSKPIKVVKGETVELPFGAPYKPVVTAQNYGDPKQVNLAMSLVGSAGETVTTLMVEGGTPPKPEFTITDPEGKVVQQGSFEYG